MKIIDCEQGSGIWIQARLGRPTASNLHKIITPAKLQLSEKRHEYMHQLLAEWLTGDEVDQPVYNYAMEYGKEQEPYAREWYAEKHGVAVEEVGFCLTDDESFGASPDGLIPSQRKGLEIKSPLIKGVVAYLIGNLKADQEHKLQTQGGLYVTGYDSWDTVIWHPTLPKIVVTTEPDKEVQQAIADCLKTFNGELNAAKLYLIETKGCEPVGKKITMAQVMR